MAKAATPGACADAPLTPPRAVLRRALAQAARDARRVADAFNVKVPVAGKAKT